MKRTIFLWLAGATAIAACASPLGSTDGDAGSPFGDGGLCPACVIDTDCNGGVCAQFAGDSFCAKACPRGQGECFSGTTCRTETSVAGDPVNICEPNAAVCGTAYIPDAGGCKGNCGTPDASPIDAGGPIVAKIGNNGGSESRLYFGIVGDTRPPNYDQTSAYPTAIISKIFSDIAALNPMPPFVVATGDYNFSSAFSGNEATKQFALYNAAKQPFSSAGGVEFPAMGNHECTGSTTSNCGPGNQYPTTNNYAAFQAALLAPIQKTDPYYVINVTANDSSWTAKFVFIAANAWSSTQAAWLDTALSPATTYTFVIRHESATANTAPGVTPSEQIMAKHPYTLAIVGHSHTYWRPQQREVIFGNGGAPLTSGNYGYGLVTQRADKSIQIDEIDMNTGTPDTKFRFALHPDGTSSP